tara:strand:+ start:335 stop:799 length:465 start_codon:yes stop_codon:yes gene_type:complete
MHPQQIHSATLKAAAQQSMSTEPKPLEQQISEAYQSASQVETLARQLEARISKIDGAKRHLPQRNYGRPVDLAKIRSNLTLTSLIAQDSAELAHYCGIDPAIRHRIDEQKEAKAMAAQSLQMRTEALRTKSQTAAAERQQRQNLAPWQRGYRSF